jgi:formate-dependent nitrite reductase cytochrome c552 subunit
MSGAGFKRPGVECLSCHEPFALAIGLKVMNAHELAKVPDPFSAKCPHCGKENEYPRGSIGLLVTV